MQLKAWGSSLHRTIQASHIRGALEFWAAPSEVHEKVRHCSLKCGGIETLGSTVPLQVCSRCLSGSSISALKPKTFPVPVPEPILNDEAHAYAGSNVLRQWQILPCGGHAIQCCLAVLKHGAPQQHGAMTMFAWQSFSWHEKALAELLCYCPSGIRLLTTTHSWARQSPETSENFFKSLGLLSQHKM